MSVTISSLPAGAALTGTEQIPIVQTGATVRTTTQAIADLSSSLSLADPTASIGLVAVDGIAFTAMRSDAAPPLSQDITPTWTGAHTFSAAVALNGATTVSGTSINNAALFTAGTLAVARGGTGQTTENAALNALLPTQAGHPGEFLTTDGSNTSWAAAGGGSSGIYHLIPTSSSSATSGTAFTLGSGAVLTSPGSYTLKFAGTYENENTGIDRELNWQMDFNGNAFTLASYVVPAGEYGEWWAEVVINVPGDGTVRISNSLWLSAPDFSIERNIQTRQIFAIGSPTDNVVGGWEWSDPGNPSDEFQVQGGYVQYVS